MDDKTMETIFAIAIVLLLFGLTVALGYGAYSILSHPPKDQTPNFISLDKHSDFLSLNCSQLRQQINADLDSGVGAAHSSYGDNAEVEAVALLQIFQIKGCTA